MKEHDFGIVLEAMDTWKTHGHVVKDSSAYNTIRHALTLAKRMQDEGNTPSPDKIVIDRPNLARCECGYPPELLSGYGNNTQGFYPVCTNKDCKWSGGVSTIQRWNERALIAPQESGE